MRQLLQPAAARMDVAAGVRGADWRDSAACRDEDPELFFPIGNTGPSQVQQEQAKKVCRRCPVAAECLKFAFDTGQDAGVWGGLTEEERRAENRVATRRFSRRSF